MLHPTDCVCGPTDICNTIGTVSLPKHDTTLSFPRTLSVVHARWMFSFRRIDLLAGLVDIVGAGSMPPLDVEAAADTLRAVLIGRTAPIAAKTLSSEDSSATSASTKAGLMERKRMLSCPATVVGRALLAWKEGSGPMKVTTG